MSRGFTQYGRRLLPQLLKEMKNGMFVNLNLDIELTEEKVLDFVTSISKNFPVSSIVIQKAPDSDSYEILKGNETLALLYKCFFSEECPDFCYEILYNWKTREYENHFDGKGVFEFHVPLKNIYDTFALLEVLEELRLEEDQETAKKIILDLKVINSILQGYSFFTVEMIGFPEKDIKRYKQINKDEHE